VGVPGGLGDGLHIRRHSRRKLDSSPARLPSHGDSHGVVTRENQRGQAHLEIFKSVHRADFVALHTRAVCINRTWRAGPALDLVGASQYDVCAENGDALGAAFARERVS
jgi:hypothetical protein